jgi:hypothetical protein
MKHADEILAAWARRSRKTGNVGFRNEHLGHEEDNEAVLFASPNFTFAVQSDLSVITPP